MDQKEQIREKVDIVELIGEYLQLKTAGSNSFKAVCPFHTEKTPSFHISGEKQIWHCFGCGEGGDCFAFVMKMEGMDFPEALRHLGSRVGIEVERFASEQSNVNQRIQAINELAAKFYRKVLTDSPAAAAARHYLEKRGLDAALQEKFNIGFALEAWDTLALFLDKRGYSGRDGEAAGLLLARRQGSGYIDRFRNRVMVPLRDQHGKTVGFTGRIMPGAAQETAKYMNSPETAIYHKGELLFGLDLAKRAIKEQGAAVIVEGNLDVIASHKAGVENVVASSGTALTESQLNLLKRFTKTLIFSFDADAAGFAAAKKGINLARVAGFDIRVAVIADRSVKDPDEAVQKDSAIWRTAVTNTVPIMQYYIDQAVAGRDLNQVVDKKAVAAFLLPELAQIQDVVEREHWLQAIADLLRMEINILRGAPELKVKIEKAPLKPVSSKTPPVLEKPVLQSKAEQAAAYILGIFVQTEPGRVLAAKTITVSDFPSGILASLYKELLLAYHDSQSQTSDNKSFFQRTRERLTQADPTLVPLYDTISLKGEETNADLTPDEVLQQLKSIIQTLQAANRTGRRQALLRELRQAETAGHKSAVDALTKQIDELR